MTPTEIKSLIARSALSVNQFADRVGISRRTVRYWMTGEKKPGPLALRALARFENSLNAAAKRAGREE